MPMVTTKKQRKVTLWDRIEDVYYAVVPYDLRPGQLWLRFKDFTWNRYSTIKPRTLGHNWVDRDDLLAHMSFEILGRFIEEECSPGHIIWYDEEGHKIGDEYVMDIMKGIWDWWNEVYCKEYPKRTDTLWTLTEDCYPEILSDDIGEGLRSSIFSFKSEDAEKRYRALTKEINDLENEMERQITFNLQQLILVRPYMWT